MKFINFFNFVILVILFFINITFFSCNPYTDEHYKECFNKCEKALLLGFSCYYIIDENEKQNCYDDWIILKAYCNNKCPPIE